MPHWRKMRSRKTRKADGGRIDAADALFSVPDFNGLDDLGAAVFIVLALVVIALVLVPLLLFGIELIVLGLLVARLIEEVAISLEAGRDPAPVEATDLLPTT